MHFHKPQRFSRTVASGKWLALIRVADLPRETASQTAKNGGQAAVGLFKEECIMK
jgi:hypothetical protein